MTVQLATYSWHLEGERRTPRAWLLPGEATSLSIVDGAAVTSCLESTTASGARWSSAVLRLSSQDRLGYHPVRQWFL